MNCTARLFTFVAFCFVSLSVFADYSDRMKSRLSEVVTAKDSGSIGEGVDGFLHLRQPSDQAAGKLVDAENADRRQLFQYLAGKTGGSVDEVARKFSQGIATKAKKGHWFRKSSGDWVQK